jgi:hypothetical protein
MRNPLTLNPLHSKTARILVLTLIASAAVLLFVKSGRTSSAPLVISEFRFRGPNGANDEFVEIYNNTDTDHTVASSDGSSGYALAASDGVIRFVIPNGTVIPARGHYLGVNSVAYSLSSYPAGNGTTATGDAVFTTDIPDNAGIALFSSSNVANLTLANRFDAAGSTSVAALYREGAGFNALIPFNTDYSFVRRVPSSGVSAGLPVDNDDNGADFIFVDTNGTSAGAGQRLGAPGPENLSSARDAGSNIAHSAIDPLQADNAAPNAGRDFTSDPPNNATFGRLFIRRKFTNNTGADITRLRFRVISLTTFPSPSGTADLRPTTSSGSTVGLTGGGSTFVAGTTLEQPPSQPNGGGFNSSLSANSVSLGSPLANGASVDVEFLMGIQQTGCYELAVVAESLPGGGSGTCGGPTPTPGGTSLIISEFRLRGFNGANDEFVEIYNNSDDAVNVLASDGSTGYAVAASDGIVRFIIPNGTIIPARGHFLGVNTVAYGLSGYPAGNATTATGNAGYTLDIGDNAGIALFKTSNSAAFTLANRLDAVGSTGEPNVIYREGAGYPAIVPFNIDCSFVRNVPAVGASAGLPQDTNNNAADFLFVDTNGTSAGAGQRLGAPGPENLSGPRTVGTNITNSVIDPAQAETASPNVVRNFASDPPNNSTFGTLSIRRTFTNNTGGSITRLRFRIVNLTTFPAPAGTADLRPRTSSNAGVLLTGGGIATANGTTLEEPPSQPNGGGFNSSMSVGSITTGAQFINGGSVNVQFLLGIQQTGCYAFAVVAEALPSGGSSVFLISGDTEGGTGTCAAPTPTPTPTPTPSPSPTPTPGGTGLIISEFRLRGPNGANDEFVEIYNNTNFDINVGASDGSSGYALAASDGIVRFVIPNGTIIPARAHYLGSNSLGYSLSSYPAGNGSTAVGDITFTTDIPDNVGIALFSTSNPANFNLTTRMDAVGPTSEANGLYKEGPGLPPLVPFSIDYSWYRNIATFGPGSPLPQDTNENAADFKFVDTNGTSAGGGQNLGAPGPQNLSAPRADSTFIGVQLLDPTQPDTAPPNTVRDFTSDPANNSTFGTLSIRLRFLNGTGADITRLRFRVTDITTFPAPSGTADLRPRTSSTIEVPVSGGSNLTVQGTTLEQPPFQPNGGGFNSSLSANSVSTATPLASGSSIDTQFLLGIQQTGCYTFTINIEALPSGSMFVFQFTGHTEGGGPCGEPPPTPTPTPSVSPSPTPSPFPTPSPSPTPTPGGTTLIISEYRLRGPNGANDEFVEIYNNSDSDVNVAAADGSTGYALVASDGIIRFVIPNGRIIGARSHFLAVNTVGYSLASHPGAFGDVAFTNDIPDNMGIALFRTAKPSNFSVATRLDAVGPTTEANALYREGAGLGSLIPFSIDYSWYRNVPSFGAGAGLPQDTGNNAADFKFVDTNGTSAGGGQRLGAPGPEGQASPGHLNTGPPIGIGLIDPAAGAGASPNFVRDFTSDPPNNSTFGTISVRRRFTNSTGFTIDRLRVRIIDLTTFPSPSGTADLRPRTSGTIVVPVSGGGTATVHGTTLEQPPSQPNGGGFNSTMSDNSITFASPVTNGSSVDLQLLFGVQQEGSFSFCAVIETAPFSNSAVFCASDDTTPPVLTSSVALTSLSQTNSDLVNVGLSATANEPATFNVQVFGDENDETPTSTTPLTVHSPDAKDIAIGTLRLRAERVNSGDGRVYLVVVTATDLFGNASRACHTVVVPKNKKGDVDAQAAAAKAFCEANAGAAPPGYFVIGDGPIIGPKQ